MGQYTCYTGGCIGSDTVFELIGQKFGVKIISFTFPGHKSTSPEENIKILFRDDLIKADEILKKVNKVLKRTFPSNNEYINNLIRRNYYQMEKTEAIFAISEIDDNIVNGGTGWCVHMGIISNIPTYVFDQKIEKWFKWENKQFVECDIPILTEKFTGIGTRDINDAGIKAIKQVYKKTFNKNG